MARNLENLGNYAGTPPLPNPPQMHVNYAPGFHSPPPPHHAGYQSPPPGPNPYGGGPGGGPQGGPGGWSPWGGLQAPGSGPGLPPGAAPPRSYSASPQQGYNGGEFHIKSRIAMAAYPRNPRPTTPQLHVVGTITTYARPLRNTKPSPLYVYHVHGQWKLEFSPSSWSNPKPAYDASSNGTRSPRVNQQHQFCPSCNTDPMVSRRSFLG